jgi:hypothetical protein
VAVLASPKPVGTQEAPLESAFGSESDYTACAIAILECQSLDIGELTPGCQSLAQQIITWEWNIKPKSDVEGPQEVSIRIEGQRRSVSTNSILQQELYRDHFSVQVSKPITSYINLGNVVTAVVGLGLSIPWLYDRVKESKEKRRKQEKEKPKNPITLINRAERVMATHSTAYVEAFRLWRAFLTLFIPLCTIMNTF